MKDLRDSVTAVQWRNDALYLLDQRCLPLVSKYCRCDDVADVVQAITDMVVRGAPAIGVTAAFGAVGTKPPHGCQSALGAGADAPPV